MEPVINGLGQILEGSVPAGLRPGMYAHGWLPAELPRGWTVVRECPNGRRYLNPGKGLSVIASGWEVLTTVDEWIPWVHLSFARRSRDPEVGDARLVLAVFAARADPAGVVLWLPGPTLPDGTPRPGGGRVLHAFARADGGRAIGIPDVLMR